MNKKIFGLLSIVSLLLPAVGFAQPSELTIPITTVILGLVAITLNVLWSVAVAFVIVMFVLAGFKFLKAQGDPSEIAEARQAVIWGVVGAAVIVLAWSIVAVVRLQIGV